MHIAILGATSQIASDLILNFAQDTAVRLHLFARRPQDVTHWLAWQGLAGRYAVSELADFGHQPFDAVLNFIGVGNPTQALAMGKAIFSVTAQFDEQVLCYLEQHPACRYIFLSSGAVYGGDFSQPAQHDTPAIIPVNALPPQAWYGVAKLHAECRHRAHADWSIIDIRVFNYISRTQDLSARFLITDLLRAIRDGVVLHTRPDYMVRDYLHPEDFYHLVRVLLAAPPVNVAVDCYSLAPIDKPTLLTAMQAEFGLRYEWTTDQVNATGSKPHYYSRHTRAAEFGYQPRHTSLQGIVQEAQAILQSQKAVRI